MPYYIQGTVTQPGEGKQTWCTGTLSLSIGIIERIISENTQCDLIAIVDVNDPKISIQCPFSKWRNYVQEFLDKMNPENIKNQAIEKCLALAFIAYKRGIYTLDEANQLRESFETLQVAPQEPEPVHVPVVPEVPERKIPSKNPLPIDDEK